ncbi:MAG: glucokinase [Spartobacteria bacterium]|nr:glucokinase [Spartobacteria bacterium]
MHILTSDIGGTNSRFAAFEVGENNTLIMKDSIWLKTQKATSFKNLLDQLSDSEFKFNPEDCEVIVTAVPGPVERKCYANLSNVPWEVDISQLKKDFGENRYHLINDFVAQAFGCRTAAVNEAITIKEGAAISDAALSVIGAGTGMGQCTMIPDNKGGFVAVPAEAGHTAFAFIGKAEKEYEAFLLRETGRSYVNGDIVVSGSGMAHLYKFFTGETKTPQEIGQSVSPESEYVRWFSRFYARACRHYALAVLPLAGIYISGGVAAKDRYLVMNDSFREEFTNCPIHSKLLSQIKISLNINEECGLWGAAYFGQLALQNTAN